MPVFIASNRSFAVLIGLALMLFGQNDPVQAGPCQSYEAAYNLEARMREGQSLKQAQESVIRDDYSDGSPACYSAIKQEISQMPYAFPLAHQAIYKRSRR